MSKQLWQYRSTFCFCYVSVYESSLRVKLHDVSLCLCLCRSGSVLKTPRGSWGCLNAKAWPVCLQCGSRLYPASNPRFICRAGALISAWTLSLKAAIVNPQATDWAPSPRINCSPKRVSMTRYWATNTHSNKSFKKIMQEALAELFSVHLLHSSGGEA